MGAFPHKGGAKNVQNWGRLWTTSDFDREYLPTDGDIQNGKTNRQRFLLRSAKKSPVNFGPLTTPL